MFSFQRRREAARAEAAREAERRALFAQLAQRPANVCPFLGLAYERTGYVEGPSIEHRCFAFGDPAPLSAEQQTRVCQHRGYGQCPRYLRGLLVAPSEDLEILRNPQAAMAAAAAAARLGPPPAEVEAPERPGRRRALLAAALVAVVLLTATGGGYLAYRVGWLEGLGIGLVPGPAESESSRPSPTPEPTAEPSAEPSEEPSPTPEPTAEPGGPAPPTPEPTPSVGDTFAFYEVSVSPDEYVVYEVTDEGEVVDQATATFGNFSFARVEPIEGDDGEVYWRTVEGGLEGFGYRHPDSGEFRVRAVFFDDAGSRRSDYLEQEELDNFPEATPAP